MPSSAGRCRGYTLAVFSFGSRTQCCFQCPCKDSRPALMVLGSFSVGDTESSCNAQICTVGSSLSKLGCMGPKSLPGSNVHQTMPASVGVNLLLDPRLLHAENLLWRSRGRKKSSSASAPTSQTKRSNLRWYHGSVLSGCCRGCRC